MYNVYTIRITTLNVRIEEKTKRAARKVFAGMGMDLSTGVKLFLNQVVTEQRLPFQPRTVNGFTPEYEERILRETKHAIKHGKRYKNGRELLKDILK